MRIFYLEFLTPGIFAADMHMIPASQDGTSLPLGIIAFREANREEQTFEGEQLVGKLKRGPWTYFGKRYTLDEVKAENEKDQLRVLISNMESNGWAEVVKVRTGQFFALEKEDSVEEDANPAAAGGDAVSAEDTVPGYPLQWPAGWPRTPAGSRVPAHFGTTAGTPHHSKRKITLTEAVARVFDELRMMGIGDWNIVLSSNVPLRLDGLPKAGHRAPTDPGAAVYWRESTDRRLTLAIDRYRTVEDNIAAIAATLNALRAVERHGGSRILERAFTGFTALPSPAASRHWRAVLEYGETTPPLERDIMSSYRALASRRHPDRPGGTHEAMAELNRARDQALKEARGDSRSIFEPIGSTKVKQ